MLPVDAACVEHALLHALLFFTRVFMPLGQGQDYLPKANFFIRARSDSTLSAVGASVSP